MNIGKYRAKIRAFNSPDRSILDKIAFINLNRLLYLSLLAICASSVYFFVFLADWPESNETEALWRMGIMLSHAIIVAGMGIACILCLRFRKYKTVTKPMRFLQNAMFALVLLLGAVIASIDQMVTACITPFLIACTLGGLMFLMRPAYSLITFLAAYTVFFFALGCAQTDTAVLLSNRINGVTVVSIGAGMSLMLWRYNLITLQQKSFIEAQQKELEDKNHQLEYMAYYDPLTNLVNRRYLEKLLDMELHRVQRYGHPSCLMLLDMDYFKTVNDNYGHPAGDCLLQKTANHINAQLREADILARFGGEEFAVLLPHTKLEEGKFVAERIRKSMEQHIFEIEEHEIRITVSIGVSLMSGEIDSFQQIYQAADAALYRAKRMGRNAVQI